MNIIDKVMEHETELITKAMKCTPEQAEWYKNNRGELIPAKFHIKRKYNDITYEDMDSIQQEEIITRGPEKYEQMQTKAIELINKSDDIPIAKFQFRDITFIHDMAADPVYRLTVQMAANELYAMICSGMGYIEPYNLLLKIDKKKSIIAFYNVFDDPIPYDLAGAISLIPYSEIVTTMLL